MIVKGNFRAYNKETVLWKSNENKIKIFFASFHTWKVENTLYMWWRTGRVTFKLPYVSLFAKSDQMQLKTQFSFSILEFLSEKSAKIKP